MLLKLSRGSGSLRGRQRQPGGRFTIVSHECTQAVALEQTNPPGCHLQPSDVSVVVLLHLCLCDCVCMCLLPRVMNT